MNRKEFIQLTTPEVNGKYGAPMGRPDINEMDELPPTTEIPKTTTRKLEMCSTGDYDIGGAYWGIGEAMYATYSKGGEIITYHRGK
jgi:hypothetical protein